MERCKSIMGAVIAILFSVLVMTAIPTEKEGAIYEDTLRLHILANSNSKADQELKLAVRDRLLEKYGSLLSYKESKSGAVEAVCELKEEIKEDVDTWIKEAGYGYTSEVLLGTEWYERREYEGFALPEGYYTSLRVMLGASEGENWWCVMYPPLCLDVACERADADDALLGYNGEETRLITAGKYTVKFKVLELVSEIFTSRAGRG